MVSGRLQVLRKCRPSQWQKLMGKVPGDCGNLFTGNGKPWDLERPPEKERWTWKSISLREGAGLRLLENSRYSLDLCSPQVWKNSRVFWQRKPPSNLTSTPCSRTATTELKDTPGKPIGTRIRSLLLSYRPAEKIFEKSPAHSCINKPSRCLWLLSWPWYLYFRCLHFSCKGRV